MPRRNIFKADKEEVHQYLGRWRVNMSFYEHDSDISDVSSEGEEEPREKQAISDTSLQVDDAFKGVEFTLDDQYDITWHLPSKMERLPLFQTSSFDVIKSELELMGGTDGKTYVFEITNNDDGILTLVCPAAPQTRLVLVIEKVSKQKVAMTGQFSLLDALQHGYFTDLTVRSADGTQFQVHRTVLGLACSGVKYRDWEMLLAGLTTPTMKAALHYIYSSTLPFELSESVIKELLELAGKNIKLSHLKGLCQGYLESNNLQRRLQELVDGVFHSLDLGRQIIERTEMTDPAKVSYACKQLAKEAAVGVSKFVLMCQLYIQNKPEMSKAERRETLEYVQGRIVVFIDHARELIQLLLAKWESLTEEQKRENAAYIIPEVERIWGILNSHTKKLNSSVGELGKVKKRGHIGGGKRLPWKVSMALQFSSQTKDLHRLQKVIKEFNEFVRVGETKRQWFMGLGQEEQTDRILRVIAEACHDGDEIITKLEDIKKKILVANALEWSDYKLMVSIICSRLSWGLNKLLQMKEPLKPALKQASKFVGQEDVDQVLVYLGLLDQEDLGSPDEGGPVSQAPPLPMLSSGKNSEDESVQLEESCLQLLSSQEHCDMEFFIVNPDSSPSPPSDDSAHLSSTEGCVIPAHRVILAARSEWFRRALQSGMIEDRNRKIVVQDIEESLFRTFLEYLYGKRIDVENITIDELIELLAVSDRYETASLRGFCEKRLSELITHNTVFTLLVAADQFSARQLREHCFQHIINDPDLLMTEVEAYSNLPPELKQEVRQLLSGLQDPRNFDRGKTSSTHQPSSRHIPAPHYSSGSDDVEVPSSSPPLIHSLATVERELSSALEELRMIVGEDPTDEVLKQHLLAADLDINRAINFYFET